MTVVVDASVAVKWVLQEEDTDTALRLRGRWREASELVLAPPLFTPEVTNVLHKNVRQGRMAPTEAPEALDFLTSAVTTEEPAGLYHRALTLAGTLDLGTTYDALYLALAESEECDLWTADRRFVRSLRGRFPRARWIGEAV